VRSFTAAVNSGQLAAVAAVIADDARTGWGCSRGGCASKQAFLAWLEPELRAGIRMDTVAVARRDGDGIGDGEETAVCECVFWYADDHRPGLLPLPPVRQTLTVRAASGQIVYMEREWDDGDLRARWTAEAGRNTAAVSAIETRNAAADALATQNAQAASMAGAAPMGARGSGPAAPLAWAVVAGLCVVAGGLAALVSHWSRGSGSVGA